MHDEAGTEAARHVATGDSSGRPDSSAVSALPDLLGYEAVEEVVLPSGVTVPCCVQLAGGLRGDCSSEMQRLARVVMETQARAQANSRDDSPPQQLGSRVGCDADAAGMSL